MYGNKFLDLWRDLDLNKVKQAWAEDLAGFSANEIKTGLDVCRQKPWPPTLPEFMLLCRPPIDPRNDWQEACEQMRVRLLGKGEDRWSRPQVYWAAVTIGWHDLNQTTWEQIKTRWGTALKDAKSDPIPEYRAALPKPGQATTSREEASKQLGEISAKVGIAATKASMAGNLKWAYRLAEREASGDSLSTIQETYWREALGVKMETDAKEFIKDLEPVVG